MLTKEGLLGFFPRLTPKRFQDLLTAFGSIDEAWHTNISDLHKQLGWNHEMITEFYSWRQSIDEQYILQMLKKENIHIVSFSDPHYPSLLKQISDPPPGLFVRGDMKIDSPTLAIVGTRSPSAYGVDVVHALLPELIAHNILIVSGLAFGIDALVHKKTLELHGKTIAVLGSGCDDRSIAPQTNLPLAKQIINNNGLIISEYPPYTEATTYTFPRRNRIIAGLCLATLVIEAGESSGALITAACSLDYNRDVFAVPQPIGSLSGIGVNNLLKQGAVPITSADDILTAFNIKESNTKIVQKNTTPSLSLTDIESTVYSHLSSGKKTIDEIVFHTALSASIISTTLSLLEIKGAVKHLGGSLYTQV